MFSACIPRQATPQHLRTSAEEASDEEKKGNSQTPSKALPSLILTAWASDPCFMSHEFVFSNRALLVHSPHRPPLPDSRNHQASTKHNDFSIILCSFDSFQVFSSVVPQKKCYLQTLSLMECNGSKVNTNLRCVL